ncbi:hypothetical protein PC116_g33323 [Phytophthora cactorum]|nr:hypothetical protein PC116_g33323 [Phytophthora cactorum]
MAPEDNLGTSAFKLNDSQTNATTQYLPFSIPSAKLSGASSFAIAAKGFEIQSFPIQDKAFIIPSLTRFADGTVSITVAARTDRDDFDPSQIFVKVSTPVAQPLTLAPKVVRTDVQLGKGESPLEDIDYWSGSVSIESPTGAVSVTLLSGEDVIDTLLLDAGVAGW